MAVFLTVGLIGMLRDRDASVAGLVIGFVLEMSLGAVLGVAMGHTMRLLLNRFQLAYEGLYPVFPSLSCS